MANVCTVYCSLSKSVELNSVCNTLDIFKKLSYFSFTFCIYFSNQPSEHPFQFLSIDQYHLVCVSSTPLSPIILIQLAHAHVSTIIHLPFSFTILSTKCSSLCLIYLYHTPFHDYFDSSTLVIYSFIRLLKMEPTSIISNLTTFFSLALFTFSYLIHSSSSNVSLPPSL